MGTLPLAVEHARLGANLGDLGGWQVPLDYGDAASEQRAVRTAVGVIDWSARGKIRVTGPDRLSYLDGVLTNDVKTLGPGRGMYAATLDHKGRVHGDAVVYDLGEEYLLSTEPGADRILAHLNKLLVSDDVTLGDVTSQYVVLGVFGPHAHGQVSGILGPSLPAQDYEHREASSGGVAVRVARSPQFGGEGFELWIPDGPSARSLFRTLVDSGASPFGSLAAEALRIEAGRPRYPVDVNEETIVLEARLDRAISMTKGCYVGQEVVSRATYIGHVNRLLVGLRIDTDTPPPSGAEVLRDDKPIGKVTSAAKSATFGRVVALGYVRREWSEPGTSVSVRFGEVAPATVSALPFVP